MRSENKLWIALFVAIILTGVLWNATIAGAEEVPGRPDLTGIVHRNPDLGPFPFALDLRVGGNLKASETYAYASDPEWNIRGTEFNAAVLVNLGVRATLRLGVDYSTVNYDAWTGGARGQHQEFTAEERTRFNAGLRIFIGGAK